jgi:hypothetical protein
MLLSLFPLFAATRTAAAPAQQGTFANGTVISLKGTPHLWFVDGQGALHWGGDTRALAGHSISWNSRIELSCDELKAQLIGDPWLSAGLLKDGDPIYLVKWEANEAAPRLLHIQSIADVELFGINGRNYGQFVIDRAAWEQRFRVPVSGLTREELPPTACTTLPAPTPSATSVPAPTPTAIPLPPPQVIGPCGGSVATLTVENDTSYPLSLSLTGPSSRTVTVNPTDTMRNIQLQPGHYDVRASVPAQDVIPFSGSWDLKNCPYGRGFYIGPLR